MEQLKKLYEYLKGHLTVKNKKKLIENTLIIIIIGVIAIIAGGSLFSKSSAENNGTEKSDSTDIQQVGKIVTTQGKDDVEKKMEVILSQIGGAGKVDVMVTYASSNEMVPAFDYKKSENETQEKDNGGGTRSIKQNDIENKIIYEESQGGTKKPVVLKELQPIVKGVVVVADGAADPEVKEKLSRAVQALTDVPTHKIQVFERKK